MSGTSGIAVTFTDGPLGLGIGESPDKHYKCVVSSFPRYDDQPAAAERYNEQTPEAQLQLNMLLQAVNGRDLKGVPYREALQLLHPSVRPVTIIFMHPSAATLQLLTANKEPPQFKLASWLRTLLGLQRRGPRGGAWGHSLSGAALGDRFRWLSDKPLRVLSVSRVVSISSFCMQKITFE